MSDIRSYIKSIETLPNSLNIFDSWDYSSRQIISFLACPIIKFDDCTVSFSSDVCDLIDISDDKTQIKLTLNKRIYWNNGEKLLPKHYLDAWLYFIKHHPSKAYFLRNIKGFNLIVDNCNELLVKVGLSVDSDSIYIHLDKPDTAILNKLSRNVMSPILATRYDISGIPVAYLKNTFCGKYFIFKKTRTQIKLKKNPFNSFSDKISYDMVSFVVESIPEKAVELFDKKLTDSTCDYNISPIAFQKMITHDNFISQKGSLFFCFFFTSPKFISTIFRQVIFNSLIGLEISDIDKRILGEATTFYGDDFVSNFSMKSSCIPKDTERKCIDFLRKEELILVYDDYYPNKIICQAVQSKLNHSNINVHLEVGSYSNPNVKIGDFRLLIIDSLSECSLKLYYDIGQLSRYLLSTAAQIEYWKLVSDIEEVEALKQKELAVNELELFIAKHALVINLGRFHKNYLKI